VIGVLGGLAAALMWGTSTLAASRSTRMIGAQQALAYVLLTGLAISLVAAPLVDGAPHSNAAGWAWAVTGGVASVAGLSCMYRALRLGKVGVVAPIGSTEGAFAAVLSVTLLGQTLAPGVAAALCVVVAGVLIVTFHGSLEDIHLRPSLYALGSAVLFGVGLVASAQAGDHLGPFWTILVARIAGLAFAVAPLAARRSLPPPGPALRLVLYSGVAEVVGFAAYIIGSQHGVAVPAVLASQFAAVAAIGSYLLFGERLARRQLAGAGLIMLGVAAVAGLQA
jgi:drug/metabolite transporter (DMT)-like permease